MLYTDIRSKAGVVLMALLVGLALHGTPADAFSSGPGAAKVDDPDLHEGDAALFEKRYEDALISFQRVIDRDPESADAWSQTGFAKRKLGHLEAALNAYQTALEIQPFHLGANEYLGELYLQTDQPDKAAEMLSILRRACPKGCEEMTALAQAIEIYRKSGGAVKWHK
jgi:tetratricopeptide (TPR) repeat protein